jgi:chemotaxis protein CheC
MTHAFHLTHEDEDQLKELLNIGVSHASTTLSKMVGKKVTISVPNLGIKNARSVGVTVKDPNAITVAVLLRLTGILEGYVLLFFPYSAATHLLHSLSGKTITDLRAIDKYDRSIFQEVGNVLTGGMLKGLSQFLHIELVQSVPDVVIDMGGAMFNSISAAMIHQHNEYLSLDVAICVDAEAGSFSCKDGEEAVGSMYLFLGPEAADSILKLTSSMINPSHE